MPLSCLCSKACYLPRLLLQAVVPYDDVQQHHRERCHGPEKLPERRRPEEPVQAVGKLVQPAQNARDIRRGPESSAPSHGDLAFTSEYSNCMAIGRIFYVHEETRRRTPQTLPACAVSARKNVISTA